MKGLRSLVPSMILFVIFAIGCNPDECYDNQNALPLAGFYDSSDTLTQVSVDSLEVYGIGAPGDSILSDGRRAKTELYLPFRLVSDTTTYVFRYLHERLAASDITDTVSFIYTREPRLVSASCGVSYLFTMQKIEFTRQLIDSVTCPFGFISNKPITNLKIFFRVDHSGDEDAQRL